MRLVLVRHGETSSNVNMRLDTVRPGASLTARGHEQARSLSRAWPRLVGGAPSAIAVSPLARTRQTAAPLLERYALSPLIRPGIREIRAGDLEMNGDGPSGVTYALAVTRWARGDLEVRMPGGETGVDVLGRALTVVDEVVHRAVDTAGEDAVAVVVAHGSVLRAMAPHLARNLHGQVLAVRPLGNARTAVLDLIDPMDPNGSWVESPWDWVGRFVARTWDQQPVVDGEDIHGSAH